MLSSMSLINQQFLFLLIFLGRLQPKQKSDSLSLFPISVFVQLILLLESFLHFLEAAQVLLDLLVDIDRGGDYQQENEGEEGEHGRDHYLDPQVRERVRGYPQRVGQETA